MSFGVFRKLTFRTVGTVLAVIVAAECVFNASVYIGAAAYTPVKYNNAMALEGKIPQDDDFTELNCRNGLRNILTLIL